MRAAFSVRRLPASAAVFAFSSLGAGSRAGRCCPWPSLTPYREHSTGTPTGARGAHSEDSGPTFTTLGSDYYNAATEEEEDRLLEEEEFAALNEKTDDEYLPLLQRLALKADSFEAELKRIHWVLTERRQLLMDTVPCTISGRPTRADAVLRAVHATKRTNSPNEGQRQHPQPQTPPHQGGSAARAEAVHAAKNPSAPSAASTPTGSAAPADSSPPLTQTDFGPYTHWAGCPSLIVQCASRLTRAAPAHHRSGKELATLSADLDYLRRGRALHALNYYSRMVLTPKRHIAHAVYQTLWNAWLGVQNACGAFVFTVVKEITGKGIVKGLASGCWYGTGRAGLFLFYGLLLSPYVHLTRGLLNSLYGPINFLRGGYLFDAMSGRWMRCTVADTRLLRHALQREKRLIRTVGRAEFRRKRLRAENKWTQRLAAMGFSVESFQQKVRSAAGVRGGAGAAPPHGRPPGSTDPYEVLSLRRTATPAQVKQQYKALAKVFHPDVAAGGGSEAEKRAAHERFERISAAYQVLSNPEKRRAYDLGGIDGLSLHETRYGHFMSRTPEQIVQSIFGGESFRRLLVGELLRSHWSLRFEAQVSVSLHEFEELQCIRTRQMAMELAAIADVHARHATPAVYYKNSAQATGAVRRTVVHSGSLPDPLGERRAPSASARRSPRAGGARRSDANSGSTAVMEDDMKQSILEELGGAAPARAATHAGTRTRAHGSPSSKLYTPGHPSPSSSSAAATAASATDGSHAPSPYTLVPGTNEYNRFSKDFEVRCDRFVARLADACFGPELLNELGEAYVISAQRFLGIRPFYAPKKLAMQRVGAGIDRVWAAFTEKVKMDKDELAQRVMHEYFSMEFDNVVADLHMTLRFAAQTVLQDCFETDTVRRKRCYAVWFLGERMKASGAAWGGEGKREDSDLVAYVQQAATSSASTSKPPVF